MKYEFHVGDYVEQNNGAIGYITNVSIEDDGTILLDVQYLSGGVGHSGLTMDKPPYFFNRIGQYDFTKPEQPKEIDKLDSGWFMSDLSSKVNELVDAVNELRKANSNAE